MSAATLEREPVADIVMVEDDAGTIRAFQDYSRARGDVELRTTRFAAMMKTFIDPAVRRGRTLDAFLLDVRLPNTPEDLEKYGAESLPPRALDLVRELADNPHTAQAPVVVGTRYAREPEVNRQLDRIKREYGSTVQVCRDRLSPMEAIGDALRRVRKLAVTVQGDPDCSRRFLVIPQRDGRSNAHVSLHDLEQAQFRLNGCPPIASMVFGVRPAAGVLLEFENRARFYRDTNFLLIRTEDGRKTFLDAKHIERSPFNMSTAVTPVQEGEKNALLKLVIPGDYETYSISDLQHVLDVLRDTLGLPTRPDVVRLSRGNSIMADIVLSQEKAELAVRIVVDGRLPRELARITLVLEETTTDPPESTASNMPEAAEIHRQPATIEPPAIVGTESPVAGRDIGLTGPQFEELTESLFDAFPSVNELERLLHFRLEKNLASISIETSLKNTIYRVIKTAQSQGWTLSLIRAARKVNPGNPRLFDFAQGIGLAVASPQGEGPEKLIDITNGFLDVHSWCKRLSELEAQICRIEIRINAETSRYGTGFLVGSNLVLTNYHVIKPVIVGEQGGATPDGAPRAADVVLRFDYKRLTSGGVVNRGVEYRLAPKEWLVDSSPASPVDNEPEPKSGLPKEDELDYALLRVEGPAEEDGFAGSTHAGPGSARRNWIHVPPTAHPFRVGEPLFILQHPNRAPLQLALATDGVLHINANQTRVRYRTNTEHGASGSPCFSKDWELVALHHYGDPDYTPGHQPTYNEGIPIAAIRGLLEKRGHLSALTAS
jgi:CheY-like chemotaxis protein